MEIEFVGRLPNFTNQRLEFKYRNEDEWIRIPMFHPGRWQLCHVSRAGSAFPLLEWGVKMWMNIGVERLAYVIYPCYGLSFFHSQCWLSPDSSRGVSGGSRVSNEIEAGNLNKEMQLTWVDCEKRTRNTIRWVKRSNTAPADLIFALFCFGCRWH